MILRKLTLTIIFILIVIAVITSLIVLKVKGVEKTGRVLKVFCAGSLKIPLDKLAEKFEKLYGVKVHIEASGSVEAIRKIIDLGRCSDVLVVADYELIPLMMIPKYADWYIAFASNEVVLAYTDKSRYRDLLSKNLTSWFNVLMKNDVYYGFSDPNKDPCGYRSIGILILASLYYKNLTIMRKLLLEKTNIKVKFLGDEIHIYIPPNLEVTSRNLIVKPKSVDLISLLEIGELDYAFEYKSVAIQHKLNYVELPDEINLGNPKYEKFYSKIVIHLLAGTPKEKIIRLKSIVYGVTIPKCAESKDLAIKFIKLLLSDVGRQVFEELGQPFLSKPIGFGNVPEELKEFVEIKG